MEGKYRKIMVEMRLASEGHQFWKREEIAPVCYVESYKEKRAIFFQCRNLNPKEQYHLLLMGEYDGKMTHQAFGPLHTSSNGELQYYRTFGGAELESYSFCILCGEMEDGDMDIIYKGSLFSKEILWDSLFLTAKPIDAFTPEYDETGAQWFRTEEFDKLPKVGETCLPWMERYGHCIIGRKEQRVFLGVPGRFLQKEQPLREEGIFLLWQPMRGGEAFFDRADRMTSRQQEEIFGYWIAEADGKTGQLKAL